MIYIPVEGVMVGFADQCDDCVITYIPLAKSLPNLLYGFSAQPMLMHAASEISHGVC